MLCPAQAQADLLLQSCLTSSSGHRLSKGVSDLKAHLDYCEDLGISCENLTFVSLLKQNHSTDLSSACRLR